jgi:DAK2 domain fusion protein YloV
MKPTIIDSKLFKTLITNGTIALRNDHQRINDLNVFPVPDGDTGSNMQSTMMSGMNAMSKVQEDGLDVASKALSRGLLMGARGNSGVILSQLFSGFANTFKDLKSANVKQFFEGFVQGVKQAYSAVISPVEGTILTVAREAADKALSYAQEDSDLLEVLEIYFKEAESSLERTPELLDVLKDAGVVDSGGAGFNVIIEGMLKALKGEILEDKILANSAKNASAASTYKSDSHEEFGYCTEFIIKLDPEKRFNRPDFTEAISKFGDSLAIVSDDEICKVHIHTLTPGDVLNFGQQFGEFATLKIENMTEQHSELLLHSHMEGEDCGHDHLHINENISSKYGIITVVNGKGLKKTFSDLGVACIIDGGQTMNPSTEDFVNAINHMSSEEIVIVPNNGNVLLSAEHAATLIEDKKVTVIKAKTIAQGYACLTMFDYEASIEDNLDEMQEIISNVKTGEVTFAVRDTEINGVSIKKDDYLGILDGQIICSNKLEQDTLNTLVSQMITEESEIITIMVGSSAKKEDLEYISLYIDSHHPNVEVEVIQGDQDIYSFIFTVE